MLLVRSREGAIPTECGDVVLERARRIRRELEAMRADLSMLQGLETGDASFGIVGTASRWVVPALVAELRRRAPGVRLRVNEAASERLMAEVASGELAQAVVTEPVSDRRLSAETLLEEALVGVVPVGVDLPRAPGAAGAASPSSGSCCRRPRTRCATRSRPRPIAQASTLDVRVEVEGIRLVADLVAAGAGASILPETAVPTELANLRIVAIAEHAAAPPRPRDRTRRVPLVRRPGGPRQPARASSNAKRPPSVLASPAGAR